MVETLDMTERVVFAEGSGSCSVRLIACGPVGSDGLEALTRYIKRQRWRSKKALAALEGKATP